MIGNGLLLAYALFIENLVLILGFLPGPLVQTRNLMLVKQERLRSSSAA